jgi:hypothetical protein
LLRVPYPKLEGRHVETDEITANFPNSTFAHS